LTPICVDSLMSTNLRLSITEETAILRQQERRGHQAVLKRAIDLVGALILLCSLSVLLIFIACLIVITDGVPIMYRRRVIGIEGEFDAYKFRTMCRNADAILEADPKLRTEFARNFKLQWDPRVTRLGAWLRKYSLDELPQLFNVVTGQMSLVGPRMITGPELAKYGDYQDLLKSVKPGLTGYWQTRGRQETTYEERVRMDVHYITHQTLGLDLLILLQTPWTVIKGKGAY
jgi:lipopolysaccharide/colanic/teichoic acid biosynthesis glycosyltransferase